MGHAQKGQLPMPRGLPRLRTASGAMNQVGPRVQERRSALAIQQDELCARIARQTEGLWNPGWQDISRIENGSRMVSDIEVEVLAQTLECSACWLLTGTTAK